MLSPNGKAEIANPKNSAEIASAFGNGHSLLRVPWLWRFRAGIQRRFDGARWVNRSALRRQRRLDLGLGCGSARGWRR
jgi:hypothetical protein